ncbi:MAG: hypothetical protein U1C49_01805 [Candidatus Andersenbacteria bacterium]|nr:hypothetical protein [Candidatus Andersenbacteria bacterium]
MKKNEIYRVFVSTGTRNRSAVDWWCRQVISHGCMPEIIAPGDLEAAFLVSSVHDAFLIDFVNPVEAPVLARCIYLIKRVYPRRLALVLVSQDDPLDMVRLFDDMMWVHRHNWDMKCDLARISRRDIEAA